MTVGFDPGLYFIQFMPNDAWGKRGKTKKE